MQYRYLCVNLQVDSDAFEYVCTHTIWWGGGHVVGMQFVRERKTLNCSRTHLGVGAQVGGGEGEEAEPHCGSHLPHTDCNHGDEVPRSVPGFSY